MRETLRDRLKRLAGWSDDDFALVNGLPSVPEIADTESGLQLVGATGRTCRVSLAFTIGLRVDPGIGIAAEIVDSGVRYGVPVLVLRLSGLPDKDWPLGHLCASVDDVTVS